MVSCRMRQVHHSKNEDVDSNPPSLNKLQGLVGWHLYDWGWWEYTGDVDSNTPTPPSERPKTCHMISCRLGLVGMQRVWTRIPPTTPSVSPKAGHLYDLL
jgi:hypothetical protein